MELPSVDLKTDQQIRQLAFQILSKELGIADFIQFIQSFEQGMGDYTQDRKHWQSSYTVESIAQAILQQTDPTTNITN
jgi:hypothetical protein